MKHFKYTAIFIIALGLMTLSSCRTGEILSEADPETEAEVNLQETEEIDP